MTGSRLIRFPQVRSTEPHRYCNIKRGQHFADPVRSFPLRLRRRHINMKGKEKRNETKLLFLGSHYFSLGLKRYDVILPDFQFHRISFFQDLRYLGYHLFQILFCLRHLCMPRSFYRLPGGQKTSPNV